MQDYHWKIQYCQSLVWKNYEEYKVWLQYFFWKVSGKVLKERVYLQIFTLKSTWNQWNIHREPKASWDEIQHGSKCLRKEKYSRNRWNKSWSAQCPVNRHSPNEITLSQIWSLHWLWSDFLTHKRKTYVLKIVLSWCFRRDFLEQKNSCLWTCHYE